MYNIFITDCYDNIETLLRSDDNLRDAQTSAMWIAADFEKCNPPGWPYMPFTVKKLSDDTYLIFGYDKTYAKHRIEVRPAV